MVDYIKRLKVCIRWFQDIEMSYSIEQEKLKNSLEMTQQKSIEIGKINFLFCFTFGISC
jgi:kinesin family protein C1